MSTTIVVPKPNTIALTHLIKHILKETHTTCFDTPQPTIVSPSNHSSTPSPQSSPNLEVITWCHRWLTSCPKHHNHLLSKARLKILTLWIPNPPTSIEVQILLHATRGYLNSAFHTPIENYSDSFLVYLYVTLKKMLSTILGLFSVSTRKHFLLTLISCYTKH